MIDPFRPGLAYPARSDQEFDLLTAQHLACALDAFRQADVFVFTLGLTEAWLAMDGAVFPACPGTIAGSFDPARHRFHNFTAGEVAEDLRAFVAGLRRINPGVRLVLTVSPVPLVATATGRHVLLATTYSKAALRIAAEEASRMEGVAYFPAYEIVTGPQAPHDYFEADRRTVSPAGIVAVMSAFLGGRASAAVAVVDQVAAPSLSRALIEAECEELMAER